MAASAGAMSIQRQAVLGALLDRILPCAANGPADLQPLWANEAMQRAYSMVRLVAGLDYRLPAGVRYRLGAEAEYGLAAELAALFRSLDLSDSEEVLPCAAAVRTTVRNLIQLFGPVVGQVHARDWIEPIEMPAQKRRAMVLATSELVVNALLHGFGGRRSGCIAVTLCRTEPSQARLSVADDGWGRPQNRANRCDGIASDLAALLETEVAYRRTDEGGTLVELNFPVRHLTKEDRLGALLSHAG
jgi:anti-sigma regulatory factor (Ser/Thr protein kinase)